MAKQIRNNLVGNYFAGLVDVTVPTNENTYDNPVQGIGSVLKYMYEVLIDLEGNSAGFESHVGKLYVRPDFFAVNGSGYSFGGLPYPQPYWYLAIDSTMLIDGSTQYDMSYVTGNAVMPGTVKVVLMSKGLVAIPPDPILRLRLRLRIFGETILTEDNNAAANYNLNNSRRFLYNTVSSGALLDNSLDSLYSSNNRQLRLVVLYLPDYAVDGGGNYLPSVSSNPNHWAKGTITANNNQLARWYGRDENDNDPLTVTNACVQLRRPLTTVVTDLSTLEDTRVRLRFNAVGFIGIPRVYSFIFKEDQVSSGNNLLDVLDYSYIEIIDEAIQNNPLPIGVEIPLWLNGRTDRVIGVAQSPNVIVTGSPDLWECNYFLAGASFTANVKYRIVHIIYFQVGPGGSWEAFPVISDSLLASPIPRLCVPFRQSFLSDYKQNLSDYIIASPQERIASYVKYFSKIYNQCAQSDMISSADSIEVRIYIEQDNLQYVMEQFSSIRDATGQWTNNEIVGRIQIWEFFNPANPDDNFIEIISRFRIRYENQVASLFAYNPLTNVFLPTLSISQDWTGKSVFIETTLSITQTSPVIYTDKIVTVQRIDVHNYDELPTNLIPATNCLTINFQEEDGSKLRNLCEELDIVRVEVDSCNNNLENYFIGAVDHHAYSINRIEEHESWTGPNLPQLTEAPITTIDSLFVQSVPGFSQAVALIDATQLDLDGLYRFVAIKKGPILPYVPCGEGQLGTQGDAIRTFTIGNFTTPQALITIAYDMFTSFDNMTVQSVDVDGNVVTTLITIVAQQYRGIVSVFTDTPYLRITMPPANTNWWYKVFCVGYEDGKCIEVGQNQSCTSLETEIFSDFSLANGTFYSTCQSGYPLNNPQSICANPVDPNQVNVVRYWSAINAWIINTGPNNGLVTIPYNFYQNPLAPNIGLNISAFSVKAALANGGELNYIDDYGTEGPGGACVRFTGNANNTQVTGFVGYVAPHNNPDPSNASTWATPLAYVGNAAYPANTGSSPLLLNVEANDMIVVIISQGPLETFDNPDYPNLVTTDLDYKCNSNPCTSVWGQMYYDPTIQGSSPYDVPQMSFSVSCPINPTCPPL